MTHRPDWLTLRNLADAGRRGDHADQLGDDADETDADALDNDDTAGNEDLVQDERDDHAPARGLGAISGDGARQNDPALNAKIVAEDRRLDVPKISASDRQAPDAPKVSTPDRRPLDVPKILASDHPPLDVESLSFHDLHDRVTIMLLFEQVVTSEQVQRIWNSWKEQYGPKEPLWRTFTREPGVDRERVFAVAATVYAFPEHRLDTEEALEFLRENRQLFSEAQWERMRSLSVVPVARGLNSTSGLEQLVFVTYDPASASIRQLLGGLNLRSHDVRYLPENSMNVLLRRAFSKRSEYLESLSSGKVVHKNDAHYDSEATVDNEALEAEINRSAVLALFDAMLVEAVREGASDIHVVPGDGEQVEVHFRIDGDLLCWHVEDQLTPSAFMAVVKDQAQGLDRFERDSAQDGSMQRRIDGTLIRFRLSVLPVANASGHKRSESVVIRVLDDRKVTSELSKLGLSELSLERFNKALRQPYGMVILTGPTGSGKSTTLRAALHYVVSPRRNVITVEDPVEYMVPGVRQIRVSHKLPVEEAIRYILRHDPDVVMVGEMRDRTTAELAVKLSATGHLTFSTLHTNDAASAIGRLYKMGIEPYLLAYSINLIAAQRLVRMLCPSCKQPHTDPSPDLLRFVGIGPEDLDSVQLHRSGAEPECSTCGGAGYKGRQAVAEVLELSDTIRSMIVSAGNQINEQAVRDQARSEGMLTLRESAQRLVRSGDTSIEEVIRVTGE